MRYLVKRLPTGYWIYDQQRVELTVKFRLKRDALSLADQWNAEERETILIASGNTPEDRRATFRLIIGGAA